MWELQIPALQESYHCIGIDLLGNGDSYEEECHLFEDSAAHVADVIRRSATVGLSLGGNVVVQTLARYPELVLSALASGVATQPIVRPSFVGSAMQFVVPIFAHHAARLFEREDDGNGRLSSETVDRVYRQVLSVTLPPQLSAVARKLLVVAGDKEVKAILEELDDMARQCTTATVSKVPYASHIWCVEHPELFAAMILAWVTGAALPKELTVFNAPNQTQLAMEN